MPELLRRKSACARAQRRGNAAASGRSRTHRAAAPLLRPQRRLSSPCPNARLTQRCGARASGTPRACRSTPLSQPAFLAPALSPPSPPPQRAPFAPTCPPPSPKTEQGPAHLLYCSLLRSATLRASVTLRSSAASVASTSSPRRCTTLCTRARTRGRTALPRRVPAHHPLHAGARQAVTSNAAAWQRDSPTRRGRPPQPSPPLITPGPHRWCTLCWLLAQIPRGKLDTHPRVEVCVRPGPTWPPSPQAAHFAFRTNGTCTHLRVEHALLEVGRHAQQLVLQVLLQTLLLLQRLTPRRTQRRRRLGARSATATARRRRRRRGGRRRQRAAPHTQ